MTGVERWAREVIPRLRAVRPERYVVLAPRAARASRLPGHAWEQLALPTSAARLRAALVFSPANLAPLAWPRNVVVVHDAAVLREAAAYTGAYRAWHGRLGAAVARRALTVITVSEFSRGELVSALGLRPERVVVVPGGVGPRFSPGADPEQVRSKLALARPYVLTVGTADRRKNLGALSVVAGRLRELGIDLVWAGDARGHIVSERSSALVRGLGYVDDDAMPGLYHGARAFVLPSRYEGFGLPCLEAMACGTPVVAADRGALPETCAGAALLVDPDDPDAVSDAVLRAVTDSELAARLREAGLRRVTGMTWDETARRVDEVLVGQAV